MTRLQHPCRTPSMMHPGLCSVVYLGAGRTRWPRAPPPRDAQTCTWAAAEGHVRGVCFGGQQSASCGIQDRVNRVPTAALVQSVVMVTSNGPNLCNSWGIQYTDTFLTFALMRGGVKIPLRFFSDCQKTAAAPFLARLIIHLFHICCENFRPRPRKVRAPCHVK